MNKEVIEHEKSDEINSYDDSELKQQNKQIGGATDVTPYKSKVHLASERIEKVKQVAGMRY